MIQSNVFSFFTNQWDQWLKKLQNQQKGTFYQHRGSPIIYINGVTYVGGEEAFLEWALQEFRYTDKTSVLIYRKLAADAYRQAIMNNPARSYVYMNISIGGTESQKVVVELFEDVCPKTCENFRALCEGHQKIDDETGGFVGERVSYAGSEFHRVVKGMYVQGGALDKIVRKYNFIIKVNLTILIIYSQDAVWILKVRRRIPR